MSNPGRPKGIKIVFCECGRRVSGLLGEKVDCVDCGRRVVIRPGTRSRPGPTFLTTPKRKG